MSEQGSKGGKAVRRQGGKGDSRCVGAGRIARRLLAVFCVVLVATACRPATQRWDPRRTDLRGNVLPGGIAKVDFVLTSAHGEPFDFLEQTEGYVTLLFFGYTYCPDVCPMHMANLAAARRELDPRVADRIKVVFVTTDPERDTPERLNEWLGLFDTRFIGLTGSLEEVNAIQSELMLSPAFREELPGGGYGMAHGSRVIAFTADNLAHVLYPVEITKEDWVHDLPKLVDSGLPSS